MATFEQLGVMNQVINNLYGLINDMRDNAQGYITNAANPGIPAIMVADANQYIRRLNWLVNLGQRNLTMLTNALAIFGFTVNQANNLVNSLLAVANHTVAAAPQNSDQVTTEANYILANVPNYERLW